MGLQDTVGVLWGNFLGASPDAMAQKIYDKWQNIPHSEFVRSHAYKVFEESFLNYNFAENPDLEHYPAKWKQFDGGKSASRAGAACPAFAAEAAASAE